MVFDGHAYTALVVSSSDKFGEALTPLLTENRDCTVTYRASVAAAKRALLEKAYDFVFINAPLADEFGTKFAMEIGGSKTTVCLLFVKADQYAEVRAKVYDHGVYTVAKPTSGAMIATAIDWMVTTRERLRMLDEKTLSIEEKMEEIRLVNRAKWLLIENLKISEADAHRHIEKQAMDRCVPRRTVAEEIIHTYH